MLAYGFSVLQTRALLSILPGLLVGILALLLATPCQTMRAGAPQRFLALALALATAAFGLAVAAGALDSMGADVVLLRIPALPIWALAFAAFRAARRSADQNPPGSPGDP